MNPNDNTVIYIPSYETGKYIIPATIRRKDGGEGKYSFRIEPQTFQSLITKDTYQSLEPSIAHKVKYLNKVKIECVKIANLYLLNCEFILINNGINIIGKDVVDYFAYQINPKKGLYLYPDPNSPNTVTKDSNVYWINSKIFRMNVSVSMEIPF